jgi:uncharacterized membrane protein YqaE (UPF0057 family)
LPAGVKSVTLGFMNTLLLVIIAFLLPPLAVYLKSKSGKATLLNVVLCIFFWVPGILHALWVVLK